ncbi:hypothetical protein NPIL_139211 [Nephila pilipes]|uniref:Uncharacterized protein n=1 Tax=Nephila pilipes TaxID=299642 RepID=A0A8X6P6M1_NEPPI|nr:hypothetical protein NPIL_46931 [Nephila pilipes]GFT51207.1 hypothetical protein NPIL_139211 [Nephila pilipes]
MSDSEATDSDCESVAVEEETIVVDSGQTEDQVKCIEIREMTRALANAVEIQMHIDCCIKLAEKFPHTNYESNLEMNKKEMETDKTKTTEIQGKLDLLLPFSVQNCPIHPQSSEKTCFRFK